VIQIIANKEIRLDKYISQQLNDSRNQIEVLIKKSFVKVNNKIITKNGYRLSMDDIIDIRLPKIEKHELNIDKLKKFDIIIIYEDNDILVINKPSFLIIHDAPSVKEPTLVDWLKYRGINLSTISGDLRHGIVHRLDKETSGVMVIAKNNISHRVLSAQLENKSMGRYYLAIIDSPLKEDIIVDKPIGRNPNNRLKMTIVNGGKNAKTEFKKIAISKNTKYELIAAKLYSGRTHQIRAHLNSIHKHILGDSAYGYKGSKNSIKRVYLHAYILYLIHPKSGEKLLFKASLKNDMADMLLNNFNKEIVDEKIIQDNILSIFS